LIQTIVEPRIETETKNKNKTCDRKHTRVRLPKTTIKTTEEKKLLFICFSSKKGLNYYKIVLELCCFWIQKVANFMQKYHDSEKNNNNNSIN